MEFCLPRWRSVFLDGILFTWMEFLLPGWNGCKLVEVVGAKVDQARIASPLILLSSKFFNIITIIFLEFPENESESEDDRYLNSCHHSCYHIFGTIRK